MQPDATGFEAAGVLAGSWPGGHGRCGDDPQPICVGASVTRARSERISEVVGRADLLHRAARRDLHDHGKRAEELQRLLTGSRCARTTRVDCEALDSRAATAVSRVRRPRNLCNVAAWLR